MCDEPKLKDYICHVYHHPNKLGCAIITDKDYPNRVVFTLINDVISTFIEQYPFWKVYDKHTECDTVEGLLNKYQEPEKIDPITKINQELAETKEIMVQNIDKVLARGEKIEVLMDKSKDLSNTSKTFYKKSKRLNRCCNIL